MNDFVFVLTLAGLASALTLACMCHPGSSGRAAAIAVCIVLGIQSVSMLLGYSII